MSYTLGVDLGTTYTAAAVHRDGRTVTVDLGNRSAVIPSVVFLTEDETVLTGEAARRRGSADPSRLAREFKRRVGDTVPILLGGVPLSADALMAKLLRWVVDTVAEREGELPAAIGVAHPANWGAFKKDLLGQAISRADIDHAVTITEPEAAVTYYASQERIEPGSIVAVYDLGGGTFDAAVVRKTAVGVELLGNPEGIERLGGIDFDEAVFAHVAAAIGGAVQQLDPNDPVAVSAVARLRAECVEAKEALSADTEVSIPVMLPNINTSVRLTRNEFEGMIRPALADTLVALRRALRSAGVEPAQLASVLLVGGSSRIPLVAQLVGAELGRPVAVDAHPKHGVSMGAALVAADPSTAAASPVGAPAPVVAAPPPAAAPAAPPPAPPLAAPPPAPPAPPAAPAAPSDPAPTVPVAAATAPVAAAAAAAPPSAPPPGTTTFDRPGFPPRDVPLEPASTGNGGGGKRIGLIVAAVVAVAAIVGGVLIFSGGDDDGEAGSTTVPEETTTVPENTTTTLVDPCAGVSGRCIRIDRIELDGDNYAVEWTAFNFEPVVADDPNEFHAHFFWNDITPDRAGADSSNPGSWDLTANQPFRTDEPGALITKPAARPAAADELCVIVANFQHRTDDSKIFHCFPVPDA